MVIQHNVYENGNVQSLGGEEQSDGTKRLSIGVIEPGEHHFENDRQEAITILSGTAVINGTAYEERGHPGCTDSRNHILIEAGAGVHIFCKERVYYACQYDEYTED